MATLTRKIKSGNSEPDFILSNYDKRLFNHLEDIDVNDLLCKHNCRELFKDNKVYDLSKESFDNNGFHSTVTMDEENQFRLGFFCGYNSTHHEYKFTFGDMIKSFNYGKTLEPFDSFEDLIESIMTARNSIEVEIVIDNELTVIVNTNEYIVNPNYGKPMLDKNGCLILRKWKAN